MTKLEDTAFTERLGVSHVDRICAQARVSFRALPVQDVGIDGLIEVLEGGVATGVFVGVQIKAGHSFVSDDHQRFTVRADQSHFAYWARCPLMVIGVVLDPEEDRAVWLNLSQLADDDRIVDGPYSITVELNAETEFLPKAVSEVIAAAAPGYLYRRRSLADIRRLLADEKHAVEMTVPTLEVNPDRLAAWRRLLGVFTDPDQAWQAIADAGYRLSWYYQAASVEQKEELQAALSTLSDESLLKVCCAIAEMIFEGADTPAELVAGLLSYLPDTGERIERLLADVRVPPRCIEGAIQTVEFLGEGLREDLWESYGSASTGGPSD